MKSKALTFILLLLTGSFTAADEVIFFSSVSCGPCKTQESTIKDLIESKRIKKVSIDTEEGFKLFNENGFKYIPQISRLSDDGKVIKSLQPGPRSRQEVIDLIGIEEEQKRRRRIFNRN